MDGMGIAKVEYSGKWIKLRHDGSPEYYRNPDGEEIEWWDEEIYWQSPK